MPSRTVSLQRVLLSYPTEIPTNLSSGVRTWIQLARIGSFVSNRYGKFSITKDDLAQMVRNFREITPKAPTELPIDYDHLSMDPKQPGDGMAAGWMKQLQLRGDGDELWAEVEWTPKGAEHVRNGEYRYISPSFVKDHTHKDGKKIGTTLLAAAATNHPFLEGMQALTLCTPALAGRFDLNSDSLRRYVAKAVLHLAEAGQRVMIAPGNARTQDEIGGTFEIAEVIGDGDDAFVSVKDANGLIHKWFRATELLPASSTPANPVANPLQPGQQPVVPAQMPGVPMQPVTQAVNPQQAANAAAAATMAAAGMPPNAGVPGAVPGAPPNANAAPNQPGADAKPNPFAAQKEGEDAKDKKTPEGAAGAAATKTDGGAVGGASATKVAAAGEDEEDPLKAALKKAIAGLFSDGAQRGMADMTFTLRNDKNEEVVVSLAQLEAAGIKIVPEGATAVPNGELATMKADITNLSEVVSVLKASNETNAKNARLIELTTELDRLTRNALISKATREALFAQYKEATDLTAFKALIATFTVPIVSLNKEHGVSVDGEGATGEQAAQELISLANTIAKEKGISLSDATKLAGAQLADRVETYRESFAETAH